MLRRMSSVVLVIGSLTNSSEASKAVDLQTCQDGIPHVRPVAMMQGVLSVAPRANIGIRSLAKAEKF